MKVTIPGACACVFQQQPALYLSLVLIAILSLLTIFLVPNISNSHYIHSSVHLTIKLFVTTINTME